MDKTLDRWAAISAIIGAIAAVIALWPIFFESKSAIPPVKGISIIQGTAFADHAETHPITDFLSQTCNGTPECHTVICDKSIWDAFGKGSHKQCRISYTCNGDSSSIYHTTTEEPQAIGLKCEATSAPPWRYIVGNFIAGISLLFAGAFIGRKFRATG